MTSGHQGAGERLYRLLLRAYPGRTREADGDVLIELFRASRTQWAAKHGRVGPAFWFFIVRDVAIGAWKERKDPLDARGRTPVELQGRGDGMSGWWDDLRYAGRRLVRSPGFTLTALTILVAGIGVNSTASGSLMRSCCRPRRSRSPIGSS